MRRIVLCAFSTLAASAVVAQGQETVSSEGHRVPIVAPPVTRLDEGPLRYGRVAPPENAIPITTPDPHRPPLAPSSDSHAISIDAEFGIETVHELDVSEKLHSFWQAGNTPKDQDREEYSESWTSDLVSISSQSFPWSTQCRLYFDDPDTGATYVCSATLIDGQNVITAGHCVSKGSGNGWYTNFRVFPAWDSDDDAYGMSGWLSTLR